MEGLSFVLEQALEGRRVALDDADAVTRASVLDPVREAQALVAPNKLAVVWRLLAYLRPYRRRVVLGTSAAFGDHRAVDGAAVHHRSSGRSRDRPRAGRHDPGGQRRERRLAGRGRASRWCTCCASCASGCGCG